MLFSYFWLLRNFLQLLQEVKLFFKQISELLLVFATPKTSCCLLLPRVNMRLIWSTRRSSASSICAKKQKQTHNHLLACDNCHLLRECARRQFLLLKRQYWTFSRAMNRPGEANASVILWNIELMTRTALNHISVNILHIRAATQIHIDPAWKNERKGLRTELSQTWLESPLKVIRCNRSHDWSTFLAFPVACHKHEHSEVEAAPAFLFPDASRFLEIDR